MACLRIASTSTICVNQCVEAGLSSASAGCMYCAELLEAKQGGKKKKRSCKAYAYSTFTSPTYTSQCYLPLVRLPGMCLGGGGYLLSESSVFLEVRSCWGFPWGSGGNPPLVFTLPRLGWATGTTVSRLPCRVSAQSPLVSGDSRRKTGSGNCFEQALCLCYLVSMPRCCWGWHSLKW